MYRKIFENIIDFQSIANYPSLPCPYCGEHNLIIDMDTFQYKIVGFDYNSKIIEKEREESITSIKEAYDENKFFGIFLGAVQIVDKIMVKPAKFISFFICYNCEKTVSATGTLKIDREEDIKTAEIKVEYFSPPIPMIDLSENLPNEIKNEIIQSFSHFHSDLASSGAKLRRSIEKMCFNLGYKESNLHFSITSMTKDYPNEANLLDSLKLVGNEATHSDSIHENDLLDAFEVMDYILKLYDRKKELKVANQKSLLLKEKFSRNNISNKKITMK